VTPYVALLRAINIPPRFVKMDRLVSIFTDVGLVNVSTVLASGNVLFDGPSTEDLSERIEDALARSLEFPVPVYLRTAPEITAIAVVPFNVPGGSVEISFLPEVPDSDAVARLTATATGGERLAVIGREVYWWHAGRHDESQHREATTVRILGMQTTRRSARTVARIAAAFPTRPTEQVFDHR